MFDLEKAITDAVAEAVGSGRLAELVRKHVAKLLDELCGDLLRSYGDLGKKVKEALSKELAIDPEALGLQGYNLTVLAIVKNRLEASLNKAGLDKLAKDMDELLGTNAPAEIKLSELVEQFKGWAKDHSSSGRCTIELEEPSYGGLRWLYLDPDEKKAHKYDCQFAMLLGGNGEATVHKFQGSDPKKTILLGKLYGFEKTMFQMYAAGTKVIIDEEDFGTELHSEEY